MFEHGWGMMGFGWLMPLLIIGVIFYLFQGKRKENLSAQDILDRRYANGDIDKEEYEAKSKNLSEYAKKE